jgi:Fe-coproporphyrin III synthase
VAAFRHCKAVGQKVGLRLTLSSHNIDDLDNILDFIEREDIERVCFYHLVYSGRGADLIEVPHETPAQLSTRSSIAPPSGPPPAGRARC